MLSSVGFGDISIWDRLRRFDLERRLALALAMLAMISGIATYVVITNTPLHGGNIRTVLFLLNLDLILLLLLGVVIARRMGQLVLERRRGIAGSRLHGRLVMLFAVVAVAPAIIVSVFSVFFLSAGLESWFSDRIRTALDNSLSVAEAYLEEHKEIIRADALAMAADLNREGPSLLIDPNRLQQFVNAQAALRSLTEAIIIDGAGNVLTKTGLSFAFEIERLPQQALLEANEGGVVALTSDSDDRVRALIRLDGFGDAYLFVGRFVDPTVLDFMYRTQTVVHDYQRMQSERWEIQITSALLFVIVALLILFASVWVGLNFSDRIIAPISQLIGAANRVRSGDLMARVPEGPSDDEISILSRSFNRMTSQLSSQRAELIDTNRQLDDRRRFTEAVLAGVTSAVLGLDPYKRIILPNRSAIEFLAPEDGELAGLALDEVLPEALLLINKLEVDPYTPVEEQLTFMRDDQEVTLLVRVAAQVNDDELIGYVLTFDDITALMSAQRQSAWAEVAKRIAHEIKNPLTPIRLSAERLNRRYLPQITDGRESFGNAIETIIGQVDTIGRLIGEFSAFARMPEAIMRAESLPSVVRNAILLQQSAWPKVNYQLNVDEDDRFVVPCDGEKISQALTNLLQNAVQALHEVPIPVPDPRIGVTLKRQRGDIVIEVDDNGPGLPSGERHRLLEPYVTTRSNGTGLGLAIVHKIMEEHGGRVELDQNDGDGAVFRLVFPANRASSKINQDENRPTNN